MPGAENHHHNDPTSYGTCECRHFELKKTPSCLRSSFGFRFARSLRAPHERGWDQNVQSSTNPMGRMRSASNVFGQYQRLIRMANICYSKSTLDNLFAPFHNVEHQWTAKVSRVSLHLCRLFCLRFYLGRVTICAVLSDSVTSAHSMRL